MLHSLLPLQSQSFIHTNNHACNVHIFNFWGEMESKNSFTMVLSLLSLRVFRSKHDVFCFASKWSIKANEPNVSTLGSYFSGCQLYKEFDHVLPSVSVLEAQTES